MGDPECPLIAAMGVGSWPETDPLAKTIVRRPRAALRKWRAFREIMSVYVNNVIGGRARSGC